MDDLTHLHQRVREISDDSLISSVRLLIAMRDGDKPRTADDRDFIDACIDMGRAELHRRDVAEWDAPQTQR